MNASDVMQRDVYTCSIDDKLDRVAGIMVEHDCGCVPLIDPDGKVVAMITDRDVCKAAYTEGKPLSEIPASIFASPGVTTVHESAPLEVVEGRIRASRVRRVPVVDSDQRLVGILTLSDIAVEAGVAAGHYGGLSPEAITQTLAAVSTHRP